MNNANLGGIVSSLHLGEVDNVAAHGSSGDKAAVGEVGERVSVNVGSLFLLSSPVGSSSLGTVKDTIQVDGDHVSVVLKGTVDHGALGPWDACIGNEDVQATVELLDGKVDGVLHGFGVSDVDLVSLGYIERQVSLCIRYSLFEL